MYCYVPVFLGLFEPFRRDLTRSKGLVYILNIIFYYIDASVLLGNTPLVKFIQNHIQDSGGVFSISSLVKVLMILLISSLSLKLYLRASAWETGADLEMKVGRFRLKLVNKVVMWTYVICQSFRFNDHFLAEFWISAPQGSSEADF